MPDDDFIGRGNAWAPCTSWMSDPAWSRVWSGGLGERVREDARAGYLSSNIDLGLTPCDLAEMGGRAAAADSPRWGEPEWCEGATEMAVGALCASTAEQLGRIARSGVAGGSGRFPFGRLGGEDGGLPRVEGNLLLNGPLGDVPGAGLAAAFPSHANGAVSSAEERTVEALYRLHISPFGRAMPDLRWMETPSGGVLLRDAVVGIDADSLIFGEELR